jgi:hypothetical protein
MRRSVICIVLIALLYCQCSPRYYSGYNRINVPITISDVVGEVIDTEERERYDLFKGIEDFEQAQFYPIAEGGLCAEIQTTNSTLVAVQREPQMRFILKDYIENYESARSLKRAFETKWKIIDYDALGFPITESELASTRSNSCCFVGAGFGSGALGVAALIAWARISDFESDLGPYVFAGMIGILAGLISGGLVGRKVDKDRAMDAIHESRTPRLVD